MRPTKPLVETVSNFHFESLPVNVNQESFEREVLLEKGWVLVEFWAPWSIPCRKEALMLRELALERSPSLKVVKINIGMETELAQEYQILELPSRILFLDGLKVQQISGEKRLEEIEAWLDPALPTKIPS